MRAEEFWQELRPATGETAPFSTGFPVTLKDGRVLELPIRPLPDSENGLASLIINQASFAVQRVLIDDLAAALSAYEPEVIVGLPTLGLTVAAGVAAALGHVRYVPCGTSRKFWYDEALSVSMSSVTTPTSRRLYLDPRLLPLLENRRVVLVDDVLSTGRSTSAGLALLDLVGVRPVAIGALMLQTDRWRTALGAEAPPVIGVFKTPLLHRTAAGWTT
ncbi:MAG TPA: phosphoribosyltransferase [Devosia sp.]|nr:phosphoribosyltransferase [Devosia sp.]